ncbi:MAG TPA: hypothetical protein VM890_01265 [Longimicrobium sp.]|nr:hypothetical protein [Longimicrobium sp.]
MTSRSPLSLLLLACATVPPLAAQASVPRWELQTQARLPLASTRAAVARDGSVFVLADSGLLRYAPGAPGAPRRLALPGAAAGATRVAVRGDTVVVFASGGTSLLRMDGTLLRTVRVPRQPGGAGLDVAVPEALLRDGSVIAVPRFDVELAARGALDDIPLVRVGPGGVGGGVLARRSLRHFGMRIVAGRGRVIATRQPWHDEELLAVPGGGEWAAVVSRPAPESRAQGTFRVARFEPGGRRAWERSYPYTPRELPQDAVARMAEIYAEGYLGAATPDALRAVRAALWLPTGLPPVTAAVAARDGTLWLRRESALEDSPRVRWTVLDPSGDPAGEVTVPGTWMILDADGERVWAVERDLHGGGSLLRLRRVAAGR